MVLLKGKLLIILVLLLTVAFGFSARNYFELEHLSYSSIQNHSRWLLAKPNLSQLRSGDLIFRHGRGIISNALMSMSRREKKYSHAGIISVEKGRVFVYHAIGGEENRSNKLRKDPIEVFCSASSAHSFGIYRPDFNNRQVEQMLEMSEAYFRSGLQFDTKFDLATDDKMYCTEFIYKVIRQVPGNENYISLSSVSGNDYVSCDDIYLNGHCHRIYQYKY